MLQAYIQGDTGGTPPGGFNTTTGGGVTVSITTSDGGSDWTYSNPDDWHWNRRKPLPTGSGAGSGDIAVRQYHRFHAVTGSSIGSKIPPPVGDHGMAVCRSEGRSNSYFD